MGVFDFALEMLIFHCVFKDFGPFVVIWCEVLRKSSNFKEIQKRSTVRELCVFEVLGPKVVIWLEVLTESGNFTRCF